MLNTSNILDRVGEVFSHKNFSKRTELAYTDWIYRFITFNHKKHPDEFGENDAAHFLSFLATNKNISAATQKQALNAVGFLYRNIFKTPLKNIDFKHVKSEKKWPAILSREEIDQILSALSGEKKLMVSLLYGSGLQLMECLNLRIKDVDFENNSLTVYDLNGKTCRHTLIPQLLKPHLKRQIEKAKIRFEENVPEKNFSGATLPAGIEKKEPGVALKTEWQYIFPSAKLAADRVTGLLKQHHKHESFLQKTVKEAAEKSHIPKKVSCNTFRHSFAVHLLEDGYDVHAVQKLLGHKDIRTTLRYNHVITRNKLNVHSPLDL